MSNRLKNLDEDSPADCDATVFETELVSVNGVEAEKKVVKGDKTEAEAPKEEENPQDKKAKEEL